MLHRLFLKNGSGAPGSRGSYKPAVDEGVAALAALCADPANLPLTGKAVWRAFSKLDAAHSAELARELTEAAR